MCAVENKYVDADLAAGKKGNAAFVHGAAVVEMVTTFEVAAADDNASIYRLFKNVNPDLIPVEIEIMNDAITGGTDWDLGLYESLSDDGVGGGVIDADAFVDGADLSSGNARTAPLSGMSASPVALENVKKRIYEIAGDAQEDKRARGYDIALTANVVGTAAGTITVIARFVQG